MVSIFNSLNLEVLDCVCGVYGLRRISDAGNLLFDGVGLLFCESPVHAQTTIKLFLWDRTEQGIDNPDFIALAQKQWGDWDARRFEEAGEIPLLVRFAPDAVVGECSCPRPGDAQRTRYMIKLDSGELACLN